MTDLLLAEELLLIALDDDSGANHAQVTLDAGLAGAVLLDLVAARAVRVEGDKIDAEPGQRPSHPLLSDALDAIAADSNPRTVEHWVNALPRRLKPFKRRVADGLVDRGVLSPERRSASSRPRATSRPTRPPSGTCARG